MPLHWVPKLECFAGLAKKAVDVALTNRKVQAVAAVAVASLVLKKLSAAKARAAFFATVKAQPKGVVYLYAPPRFIGNGPHFSYNASKIECFLRVHKIPYEFRFGDFGFLASVSPTGTIPMVAIEGKLYGESQFCIDAIAKAFNIDQKKGLSDADVAQEVMLRRTLDQHTVSQYISRNFIVENGPLAKAYFLTKAWAFNAPTLVFSLMFGKLMRGPTINRLNTSGLGWLDSERYQIELLRDFQALAAIVEKAQKAGNKFLFGNTATTGDCLLYSHLCTYFEVPEFTNDTAAQRYLFQNAALKKYSDDFAAAYFPDLKSITPSTFEAQVFKA